MSLDTFGAQLNSELARYKEQIWRHVKAGKKRDAIMLSQELNRRYPESDQAWFITAELALAISNPKVTLQCLSRIRTDDIATLVILRIKTEALCQLYRFAEARALLNVVDIPAIEDCFDCHQLGHIAQRVGAHFLALKFFTRAYALTGGSSDIYFNLATCYRFIGETDEALNYAQKALLENPDDAEAAHLRSSLIKSTPLNNHINDIQSRLQTSQLSSCFWHYALAKEYEDLEQYDDAFMEIKRGASIKRQSFDYRISIDAAMHHDIQTHSDVSLFNSNQASSVDTSPIFIVGLPRTGSTLVEQILLTNDAIQSAGEIDVFGRAFKAELAAANGNVRQVNFNAVGQSYVSTVAERMLGSTQRFIVKLPLIYLNIGAIALALPHSKIVCIERSPLDVCFAMYKNLFNQGYPFSYDLKELGEYYLLYRKLMTHWNDILGSRIHVIKYEALVNTPEKTTQTLFDYCELEWDQSCLSFYRNKGVSTTASSSQIRQPIYGSSVGRARCFDLHLGELKRILQRDGIEC